MNLQGSNVRSLEWNEIDPNALNGAGDVVTKSRFFERSWFIGASLICLLSLVLFAFFTLNQSVNSARAEASLEAFSKELIALQSLDHESQLDFILKERVGFQRVESVVRETDRSVALAIGTDWTAVRRSALIPAVDGAQIKACQKSVEDGIRRLKMLGIRNRATLSATLAGAGILSLLLLGLMTWLSRRGRTTLVVQSVAGMSGGSQASDVSGSSERDSRMITSAVNNLPCAIVEFESDGKIVRWNSVMASITGLSEERAVGQNLIDYLGWSETREVAKSTIRKLFTGEEITKLEWTLRTSHTTPVDLQADFRPVLDRQGSVRTAVAVVRDVTSERHNRDLLVSNDIARLAIIEALPDSLLRFDSEFNLVEIHDNSRVFGGVRDHMRGQDWQKVFGESFGERLMKAAKQAKVSQRSSAIEFMGVVAGREVGLSFRVTPSGPNDILAVVTDVSDRQRLIEAETRSEARFRSLIEGSADTIMMVSGDGIILYASPAVKRVVGLEEKSLVGRNWLEFIHKEHRPEAAAVWTSLMQGADASSTLDMISTSGDVKPIEISARNLLQNPSVKAVIFNMRDISDRRELESELRHKLVELETRNQALRDASQRDALTGVLNYQAVLSYLEAICEYATEGGSFTVALLDIDRFKEYNSTYGFQAGDELLKQLAIAATEVSREDDVFGRAGSEEFLMILPEATETEAQGVMSRVESQFESRCERAARLSWATLHISGESRTALHVMGELSDALTAIAEQRRAS